MPPRRNKRAQESEGTSNIQVNNPMENHDEDQDVQGQNPVENGPDNPFNVFMEYLRQNINPVPEQNRYQNPEPPRNTVASSFKAFQSIRPPEFKGTVDPVEAKAWLKEMEKSFEILGVAEEQKTIFATYMLKGEANLWWESRKNLEEEDLVTWERFSKLFLDK